MFQADSERFGPPNSAALVSLLYLQMDYPTIDKATMSMK
jgi:hypothetical protein